MNYIPLNVIWLLSTLTEPLQLNGDFYKEACRINFDLDKKSMRIDYLHRVAKPHHARYSRDEMTVLCANLLYALDLLAKGLDEEDLYDEMYAWRQELDFAPGHIQEFLQDAHDILCADIGPIEAETRVDTRFGSLEQAAAFWRGRPWPPLVSRSIETRD